MLACGELPRDAATTAVQWVVAKTPLPAAFWVDGLSVFNGEF
jgi:hypothetical protein